MKKTIGIITLVFDNYGTKLQSFALCKVLENIGYEPHVLNIESTWGVNPNINKKKKLVKIILTYGIHAPSKLISYIKWKRQMAYYLNNDEIYQLLEKRARCFSKINGLIPYTKDYYSFQDLRSGKYPHYDYYLVGSDQVFNSIKVGNMDIYMLDFLHGEKGLTYAASFGLTNIPQSMLSEYQNYIKNFSSLLIREEAGVILCKKLKRSDAKLVLDPTLLLNSKDYMPVYEDDRLIEGDFVLVYSLNNSLKIYNQAQRLAKSNNCKMVMLKRSGCPPSPLDYSDSEELYDVSPGGFLWLIKNSKCVVTNSYHAFIFSVLYETSFYLFLDNADEENSRMLTLAKSLQLDGQIYWESDSLPKVLPTISYKHTSESLDEMRKESTTLLINSIA